MILALDILAFFFHLDIAVEHVRHVVYLVTGYTRFRTRIHDYIPTQYAAFSSVCSFVKLPALPNSW